MLNLLKEGHYNDRDYEGYQDGSDAVHPLFVYNEKAKTNKKKHKGGGGEEPVVKQQRTNGQRFGCRSELTLMVYME